MSKSTSPHNPKHTSVRLRPESYERATLAMLALSQKERRRVTLTEVVSDAADKAFSRFSAPAKCGKGSTT